MTQTQLPEDVRKAIEQEADEYARTYSGTKTIKRPYKAGAEKWALACIQKDEEIARLSKALKRIAKTDRPGHPFNTIATMAQIATEALKQ